MSSTDTKIRVRFVTKFDQYRVIDTPFAVPSKLGRYGLSEVVNHLLDLPEVQPFDFLINDRLLRVSIDKYVTSNKISIENVIEIEYLPAVSLSEESQRIEVPAWVGCVDCSLNSVIISGCYDGQILFNDSNNLEVIGTIEAHEEPIRAIKYFKSLSSNLLITGSKDHSVKCWKINYDNIENKNNKKKSKNIVPTNYSMQQIALFSGHVNSVESLNIYSTESNSTMLLSGDWSGNIFAWDINSIEDDSSQDNSDGNTRKKMKGLSGSSTESIIKDIKPCYTLRSHSQAVSGISTSSDGKRLFSCSWDHSIKEWDVEKQDCITTWVGSKVITSIDVGKVGTSNHLVASSHPDGKIRLWDSRTQSEALGNFTNQSGQKNWISCVKWHPTSENLFTSSDYDGSVKVWDMRANIPIGSTQAHEGKALCVDWLKNSDDNTCKVISGGSDCNLIASLLEGNQMNDN